MKTCILLTSKDTDFLADHAQNVLSGRYEVKGIWRLNRKSPSISRIRTTFDHIAKVDYLFNFLSPKLVPVWLLQRVRVAAINIHPGSFEYPGVGSASYAIFDKKSQFGVSAHYMTEFIDEGGIFAERFFEIDTTWGCKELFDRALEECCNLFNEVVAMLEGNERPEIVRDWSKKAVTRAEFDEWMRISEFETEEVINLKIKALKHPTFPGPFIVKQNHVFGYLKTLAE